MKWIKYTIETTNEATDIVASVLFDNGICGAEIDDTLSFSDEELKAMHVDIPVIKENTGIANVSFYVSFDHKPTNKNTSVVSEIADNSYVAANDNIFTKYEFDLLYENIINELNEYKKIMDMGTLKITTTKLDDKVFLNKWKENFKRFDIMDISIIPSWEKDISKSSNRSIYIEPGSAFGTGKHPTTKLCIKSIKNLIDKKYINPLDSSLLDIGCGSGILAIISKKLGINNIMAIDVDESVKENLVENIAINFLDKTFSYNQLADDDDIMMCRQYIDFDFGNIINNVEFRNKICENKFNIIVANILAPVIVSLLENAKIGDYLEKNGWFICSGIIIESADDVEKALKNAGFRDIYKEIEDNWVYFTASA